MGELTQEQVILQLINSLRNENDELVQKAKDSIISIGVPAIPPLFNSFVEDMTIRQKVIELFYGTNNVHLVRALLQIFESVDGITIRAALTNIELTPAFHDDTSVLKTVIDNLITKIVSQVRDKQAVQPLIEIINLSRNRDCLLVYAATRSLAYIGDERAIEPLLRALKFCNATGAGVLYSAIGSFGESAKLATLEAISSGDENIQEGASLALSWLIKWGGYNKEFSILAAALDSPLALCRETAIEALSQLEDERVIPILEGLLEKPDTSIYSYSNRAIKQVASEAITYFKSRNSGNKGYNTNDV